MAAKGCDFCGKVGSQPIKKNDEGEQDKEQVREG